MTARRTIEVFSAGCPLCDDALSLARDAAGSEHEVAMLDLQEEAAASRAQELGVRSVPAVAVDGELLDCCTDSGISEQRLKQALASSSRDAGPHSHEGGCC